MAALARRRYGLEPAKASPTFAAYAPWYLQHRTPTKRSATRERGTIARLVAFFGPTRLDAIDKQLVLEYMTARTATVTPASANREVDVLKDMLAWAVPKHLAVNPLIGMKRLRGVKRGIRILTVEEEKRLIKIAAQVEFQRVPAVEATAFLLTAVDAFIRLGDLVALTPDQYFRIYIHIEDPKIAPYDVKVSRRMRTAITRLRRAQPDPRWLFPTFHQGKGSRPAENRVVRWFAELCTAAHVPHGRTVRGVTFHSLRHTGATRFLQKPGHTVRDLMQQGGWADLKSVMRYTHPSEPALPRTRRRGMR